MRQESSKNLDATCNSFQRIQKGIFFRNAVHVHSSAVDNIGQTSCKHEDLFDENDEEILGFLKKFKKYR